MILEDEEQDEKFEQLAGKGQKRKNKLSSMLSVQHRMHPHIAEVISNVFYKNELFTDAEKIEISFKRL